MTFMTFSKIKIHSIKHSHSLLQNNTHYITIIITIIIIVFIVFDILILWHSDISILMFLLTI